MQEVTLNIAGRHSTMTCSHRIDSLHIMSRATTSWIFLNLARESSCCLMLGHSRESKPGATKYFVTSSSLARTHCAETKTLKKLCMDFKKQDPHLQCGNYCHSATMCSTCTSLWVLRCMQTESNVQLMAWFQQLIGDHVTFSLKDEAKSSATSFALEPRIWSATYKHFLISTKFGSKRFPCSGGNSRHGTFDGSESFL